METTPLLLRIYSCTSVMLGNNAWVFKIQPRAFGSKIHSAAGITGPAVEALVPEVVWIGVGRVLHTVVAFAVEPV